MVDLLLVVLIYLIVGSVIAHWLYRDGVWWEWIALAIGWPLFAALGFGLTAVIYLAAPRLPLEEEDDREG